MKKFNPYKKYRRVRRRRVARRFRRSLTNRSSIIHLHKRTYTLEEFIEASPGGKTYTFKLADMARYTEFTELYDQFRLLKWVIKVYYAGTDNDVSGTKIETGLVGSVIDYNDTNVPSTIDELREYSTYRERQLIRCHPWTRAFVPKVNSVVYKSGVTSGYTIPKRNPWLSTIDAGTPHFGLKMYYQTPPTNTYKVTVVATAYLAMKATK